MVGLVLSGTVVWVAADNVSGFQFDKGDAGRLPAGWKAEKTGKGEGSIWKVVEDKTAPSRKGVSAP